MKARLGLWLLLLTAWFAWATGVIGYTGFDRVARVQRFENQDRAGIVTFQLHFGEQGTVTVMADADLDLARTLGTGGKVRVTLTPIVPERLDR